jgi:hypothetical protein
MCSLCHLPPVVCRRTRVLFTLCFPGHSGVQHILCCVFCFRFLCLMYPYDASLSNVYCYIISNEVSLLRCPFHTKIILMRISTRLSNPRLPSSFCRIPYCRLLLKMTKFHNIILYFMFWNYFLASFILTEIMVPRQCHF